MENFKSKGLEFEKEVAQYLYNHGYEIVARNCRLKTGEIDIIARDKDRLCFIEVKSRDITSKIHPFEAVDLKKQRKLITAAKEYIMLNKIKNTFFRFDVVGVTSSGKKALKVELVKGAFLMS